MKYTDGRSVALGDVVDIGGGKTGTVVAVIEAAAYAPGYSAEEWGYLLQGALLEADGFGLLHQASAGHDFVLVRRG